MRTYFNACRFGSVVTRVVAALVALGISAPCLASDFRGGLLNRVRSAQGFNGFSGKNVQGQFRTQVSDPNAGHTLGKRKLKTNTGSQVGQIQLDPNAGYTLGKRKLNMGSNLSTKVGLKPWEKSRVVPAANGNTGFTGAGLPAGMRSRTSSASRVATPQPQQVMSLLPGVPDWADPVGTVIEEGAKIITGDADAAGSHTLPPATSGGFEGSISAKADDPNAGHTLGKRKKPKTGSLAGKFDPNANTSVQLPNLPGGGTNAPTNPAPTTPAPPMTPAPAPQGKTGGGVPWGDVIVGTAIGLADRPQVYESPVYVPVVQAPVQQAVAVETPVAAAVPVADESEVAEGTADLVLENIERIAPPTMLVGPAYRVTFRNQSAQAVGAFRVAVFAGTDGKLSEDAPRAAMQISGLQGGEVGEATLRLPGSAMKLVSSASNQQAGFSHLFVAVDVTNDLVELDEGNNHAIVERAALETAAE